MTDMRGSRSVVLLRALVQREMRNKKKNPKDQNMAWMRKYVMFINPCR